MNESKMAPIPRHRPFPGGIGWGCPRNYYRDDRSSYAFDSFQCDVGAPGLFTEIERGREIMDWLKTQTKLYPYLLPYIAVIGTIELIVEVIRP